MCPVAELAYLDCAIIVQPAYWKVSSVSSCVAWGERKEE